MIEVVVTTGAISRAKLHSNRHHQQTNIQFFYRPDVLPVSQPTWTNSVKALKGKYHIPWTCLSQAHLGVLQLCLWPLIVPVNLRGWLPCLSSALWRQYPTLGSMDYINTTQGIAVGHIYCNVVIPITDGLCAHFWYHATHVCEWNVSWKVLEKKRVCWVLENPGIWYLQFLESPGKWDLNVCTNHVACRSNLSSSWTDLQLASSMLS